MVDRGCQIAVEVLIRRLLKGGKAEAGLLQTGVQPLVVEVDQTRDLHAGQQAKGKQHHPEVAAHIAVHLAKGKSSILAARSGTAKSAIRIGAFQEGLKRNLFCRAVFPMNFASPSFV